MQGKHITVNGLFMALLLLASGALVSCSSAMSGKGSGRVQHVVLCWLKDPGNAEAQQKLIDVSYSFTSLPGVVQVAAGRTLASDRDVVDDSFDVGIVIVFEDQEALRNYGTNPTHLKALKEVLAPVTERLLIYDIVE